MRLWKYWIGWVLTGLSGFSWVGSSMLHVVFHPLASQARLHPTEEGQNPRGQAEAREAPSGPGSELPFWHSHCILHKASWVWGEEESRLHLSMGGAVKSRGGRYREKGTVAIFSIYHTQRVYTHVPFPLPPFSSRSRGWYVTNWSKSEFSVYPAIMMDIYL